MTAPVRTVGKYKETIADMNREWSFLLQRYKVADTRTAYLLTFEMALALNLGFPLWENKRYFRVTNRYPLPDCNERPYVSPAKFRYYMMLYTYVMRDAGLLTREEAEDRLGSAREDLFRRRRWSS